MLSRSKTLEKASIAERLEPIKALEMQNVLKQLMHCGALLWTQAMWCCTAGLWKVVSASLFKEPTSLVSSTTSHSTLRSFARSLQMRLVTERFSLGSICLVGESCTFLISLDAVFMGAVSQPWERSLACRQKGIWNCCPCGQLQYVLHECREWIGLESP